MAASHRFLAQTVIMGVAMLASGCIIHERRDDGAAREEGYREGYYDRDRNRYYHDHTWHECRDHDDACR